MAGVRNMDNRTRLLKESSAIERSNKGGFRSGSILALSPKSQVGTLELDLPPQLQRATKQSTASLFSKMLSVNDRNDGQKTKLDDDDRYAAAL